MRWPGLAIAVCLLVTAVPLRIAVLAYLAERRTFKPGRHAPRLALKDFGIEGLRDVTFPSRDGAKLRAVFAPPRRGALVVLAHGSGGDHCDVAAEARILTDAGFGVLALDLPGQGQSEGKVEWGEAERQAIAGALDFASSQPGVDADKLGAFGFSLGGYIVVQSAVVDTRLKAIAVAGTTGSYYEHTFWEYRRHGILAQWPALLAKRQSGMKLDELVPQQVIGRIAPRPVLLISGGEDQLVPTWMSRRLFHEARDPKTLLIVPNAGHGAYAAADPQGYAAALLKFFGCLLQ